MTKAAGLIAVTFALESTLVGHQAREYFLKSLTISQENGQTRELLGALRDFANVYISQGQLEKSVELLAVVLSHRASEQNSLFRQERLHDEAEKLRRQLENQLDKARYHSASETGQERNLSEAVAQILGKSD